MKKIFFLAAILSMGAVNVSAQSLLDGNKLFDNWSVGINAGSVTPFKHHAFFKSMRPVVGVEVNKQWTPILGMGIEMMTSVNTSTSRTVFDHSNLSLLGKVNLNNLFIGYRGEPNVFEMEAVTGIGWLHTYMNGRGDSNDLSFKVGLNLNFNLGSEKAWTLAVKPALVYNLEGDAPEKPGVRHNANNAFVELTAGLLYHFNCSNGKHHFDYSRVYDRVEVDGLNAKVNDLRSQIEKERLASADANRQVEELKLELEAARNAQSTEKQQVRKEERKTLESVITFRQGKITIDPSQQPNVERIAVYMKNHPAAKVHIKGYASPEGNVEVNERIALQRAEAVKDFLVKKYRIEISRITAEGQGVGNMFVEPDWNRVSICTLEDK